MYRLLTKLIILLVISLILGACSGTRAFKNQSPTIERNEVYEAARLSKNNPVNFIITTPSNKKFLGIPIGKILYETAHPDPKGQFEKWLKKKKNRQKRLEKWISQKQIDALSTYGEKFNAWLKKTGEPPAVLDSTAVEVSKKRIVQYYKNLGYYDVEVSSNTEEIESQKPRFKIPNPAEQKIPY